MPTGFGHCSIDQRSEAFRLFCYASVFLVTNERTWTLKTALNYAFKVRSTPIDVICTVRMTAATDYLTGQVASERGR